MRKSATFRSFFLLLALVAGCSGTSSAVTPDGGAPALRIPVTLHGDSGALTVQAELADTVEKRTRGLMFREHMEEEQGMLFLFPVEQQLTFWMRNTLIPLDMIFIRADHTILGVVENATPRTDTARAVPGASQFVLEVNGGVAAKYGVKAGQTVDFYAPTPSR